MFLVTWTKYHDSYPEGQTITTGWGNTWVTVAPDVRRFIAKHTVPTDKFTLQQWLVCRNVVKTRRPVSALP